MAADRPKMTPPSICAGDVRHVGDDAAEALGDGDAAAFAGRQRAAPVGQACGALERRAEPRLIGQEIAPELERILAGGMRELVDERLLEEPVLRVEDRAPRTGRN